MLRHSCGYHLANLSQVPDLRLIQDYLGHKNIKNTARYTRTSARRFEGCGIRNQLRAGSREEAGPRTRASQTQGTDRGPR